VRRHNHLYPRITAFENLLAAARKAQRGKRFKPATARFNLNLEGELLKLQRQLNGQTYRHGGYRDFWIHDPKQRLISAAPYRDRVVHHALCNIIEPIFDRTFIHDSYACRQGKGTHAAVERYSAFARRYPYVLKCDIRKYFQSVDHEILMAAITRKIKCTRTLWLIGEIIASRRDDSQARYFKGDDLFTPFARRRAIPIGNLTSQFFANVYLNGFDHYVKEHLGCRAYIRYVDDCVVFDRDKARLGELLAAMRAYLETLRLTLHKNKCRVYRVSDGVTFLG
jgi:retron-type reverse transcriptase